MVQAVVHFYGCWATTAPVAHQAGSSMTTAAMCKTVAISLAVALPVLSLACVLMDCQSMLRVSPGATHAWLGYSVIRVLHSWAVHAT